MISLLSIIVHSEKSPKSRYGGNNSMWLLIFFFFFLIYPTQAVEDEDNTSTPLEPVCRLNLTASSFQSFIMDGRVAQVVTSFTYADVIDIRSVSMDCYYKTILCTDSDDIVTTISAHSTPDVDVAIITSIATSQSNSAIYPKKEEISNKIQPSEEMKQVIEIEKKEKKFLSMLISNENENNLDIEININYLLALVALDVVKDIYDVANTIAYDLLNTVKIAEKHVVDAAGRFSAALQATNDTISNENENENEKISNDNLKKNGENGISKKKINLNRSENIEYNKDGEKDKNKCIYIHVNINNPFLLLLNDSREKHSSSLMLNLSVNAQISFIHWGGDFQSLNESEESLHMSVRNIQLYVLPNTRLWLKNRKNYVYSNPGNEINSNNSNNSNANFDSEKSTSSSSSSSSSSISLCDPFSTDVHFTRHIVQDIPLASKLTINVSDVKIILSLPHVILIQSIVMRRRFFEEFSSKTKELNFYCLCGDNKKNENTQINVYILVLNVGLISITATDDMNTTRRNNDNNNDDNNDNNNDNDSYLYPVSPSSSSSLLLFNSQSKQSKPLPLIRIQLLHLQLNADSVLNPKISINSRTIRFTMDVLNLESSGNLAVGMDFFNPQVLQWEPLLEGCKLNINIKKQEQEIKCNINDINSSLQLNISGKLIDTIINTYSTWMRYESEKNAHQPSKSSSSLVRRHSVSSVPSFPSIPKGLGLGLGLGSGPGGLGSGLGPNGLGSGLIPKGLGSGLGPKGSESAIGVEVGLRNQIRTSEGSGMRIRSESRTGIGIGTDPESINSRSRRHPTITSTWDSNDSIRDDTIAITHYPLKHPQKRVESLESKILGPYLILHNRLLSDLFVKIVSSDIPSTSFSASAASGQATSAFSSFFNPYSEEATPGKNNKKDQSIACVY